MFNVTVIQIGEAGIYGRLYFKLPPNEILSHQKEKNGEREKKIPWDSLSKVLVAVPGGKVIWS